MFISSPTCAIGQVEAATRRLVAIRSRYSGVPRSGRPSMPKIPAMITSSVIACMRGASANGLSIGQLSISRSVASAIVCCVVLDRLAVKRGQQQLALAHVARADGGQDRVRAEDRPQRRLAGQRGRLLGLGGEQRAHVVGVAGDDGAAGHRRAHAEDVAEAPPGAEDELDLALVEAQHLGEGRQRDDGGLAARGLGGLDRAGGGRRRLADQAPGPGAPRRGATGSATMCSPEQCYTDRCPTFADFRIRAGSLSTVMCSMPRERRDQDHRHGRPGELGARRAGALIEAGADVLRLNFSHADRDRHARTIESIREAAGRVGREVAVLGDLPGPKLRIGELRDDVAELETGMHVKLTPQEIEGDGETIPVAWPGVTSLREDELGLPGRRGDPPARARAPRTAASIARSRSGGRCPRTRG